MMTGSFLGCGPGVNFVPGPLPPPVPGPVSHGQHRGPVVHRGMPRCVPSGPYHVPRMRAPCRQRVRHSDRLIHMYKLDRRPSAHSGTWPGQTGSWAGTGCANGPSGPACHPGTRSGCLLWLTLFLSIAVTNKSMEEQSGIFLDKGVGPPNRDLKSLGGCLQIVSNFDLSPHAIQKSTNVSLLLSHILISTLTESVLNKNPRGVSCCQQHFGIEKYQGLS